MQHIILQHPQYIQNFLLTEYMHWIYQNEIIGIYFITLVKGSHL